MMRMNTAKHDTMNFKPIIVKAIRNHLVEFFFNGSCEPELGYKNPSKSLDYDEVL
jgi:hypothetical protein